MDIEALKEIIVTQLEEKKAENIKALEVSSSGIAKYMIFASGKSTKNVGAIAEHVATYIKNELGLKVGLEGLNNSSWAILDVNGIIVHVFHPETRQYYNVEELFENKYNNTSPKAR